MQKLKNFTLIDGLGNIYKQSALSIADDGTFHKIFTHLPDDFDDALDLNGQYLLPGLVDCHVHLMADASADPFAHDRLGDPHFLTLIGASNAARMLQKGVTTIRDLGGVEYGDIALKKAIQQGIIPGPRMLASGKLLTMTGGHGWFIGHEVDGVDAARKYARLNIKMGADNIKMMASGGIMTPNVSPHSPSLTLAELQAGFEEAHKAGKITASHAQANAGIKNALRAGVRTIEHGFWLDEEACEMMLKNDTYYGPTLLAGHQMLAYGEEHGVPKFMVDKLKMIKEAHQTSFQLALTMGVGIICSTDAGTPFNQHGDCWRELQLMKNLGMSAMNCLVAATSIGAQALKLDGITGAIEPGKMADFMVVSEDPTQNLETLAEPVMVFKEGQPIPLKQLASIGKKEKATAAQALLAVQNYLSSGCACC